MESPPHWDGNRADAYGERLIEIHDWLRDELTQLRADLHAFPDGSPAGGTRLRDLRTHCLAFCTAVTGHHTAEDEAGFPALAEHMPELTPVLEQLQHDHGLIADVLTRLEEVTCGADPAGGPEEAARIDREVEGLAAILESHFRYEERTLFDALNDLGAAAQRAGEPE